MVVVIAEKVIHRGALFGHIGNGGGTIALSHGKALKISYLNKDFLTLQVLEGGIGKDIKGQSWQKTKVVEKAPKRREAIHIDEEVGEEGIL